jgi:hypothetical protein
MSLLNKDMMSFVLFIGVSMFYATFNDGCRLWIYLSGMLYEIMDMWIRREKSYSFSNREVTIAHGDLFVPIVVHEFNM